MLVRQADVEARRWRAEIEGATIGGLHDPWAGTGHDDDAAILLIMVGTADQSAELACGIVEVGLGRDAFGRSGA